MAGRKVFEEAATPPRSTGAAGELCHVLAEGWRGELQALHCGEVGEDRRTQRLCGHPEPQGQGQRLHAVGTLGRESLPAEQPVGRRVRHQLDEPAHIPRRERPRHLVERHDGRFHVVARGPRPVTSPAA